MGIAARRFRRRVVACRGNPRALLARQKSHHRRPMASYEASQNQILFSGKARFGLANPGSNFEMKPETRRMLSSGLHFEVRAGSRLVEVRLHLCGPVAGGRGPGPGAGAGGRGRGRRPGPGPAAGAGGRGRRPRAGFTKIPKFQILAVVANKAHHSLCKLRQRSPVYQKSFTMDCPIFPQDP